MAAGDRTKSGKPSDIVRHYLNDDRTKTMCGRSNWGYGSRDKSDTSCIACKRRLENN